MGRLFEDHIGEEFEGCGLEVSMSKRLAQLLCGDVHGQSDEEGNTYSQTIEAGALDGVKLVEASGAGPTIDGDLPI